MPAVDVAASSTGSARARAPRSRRAITLRGVEPRPTTATQARELLAALDRRRRPTPSGSASPACPGVGKSTFIETLGTPADRRRPPGRRARGRPVVSARTGGSVLGDKTRMAELAADPRRLHPALARRAGTLGGVARATRRRCSCSRPPAYDVVLVETVGVGQSEVDRRRHGRHLPVPHPGPHRRPAPGHQEGHPRARRRDRGQQGRRRPRGPRPGSRPASWPARCGMVHGRRVLAPAGAHLLGADRRGVDDVWRRCSRTASTWRRGLAEKRRARQQLDFMWALVDATSCTTRCATHRRCGPSGTRSSERCGPASCSAVDGTARILELYIADLRTSTRAERAPPVSRRRQRHRPEGRRGHRCGAGALVRRAGDCSR